MITYLISAGIAMTVAAVVIVTVKIAVYARKHSLPRAVTYTDELIANKIPFGFYVVCGAQGAGKTSLVTALMITDYKHHGAERLMNAMTEVDELNSIDSTYNLHYPEMTYFSREPIALQGDIKSGLLTQRLDISEFGLPSENWHPKYLPQSSFVFFPELDVDLYCRNWQKTPSEIIQAIKYVRHIDLTLFADMQVFDRLDKALGYLATDLLYVFKKWDKYKKVRWWSKRKELVSTTWHFLWIKPQVLTQAKALHNYGVKIPVENYFRNVKFVFEGNIHKHYDAFSGKCHWRLGIEDFYSDSHVPNDMRRDSVSLYCSSFGILPSGEIPEE